jgi:hypothetical protein
MAAVPPIGPSPRHVRLPPKAHAAIAAGPTLDPDLRPVIHRAAKGIGTFLP